MDGRYEIAGQTWAPPSLAGRRRLQVVVKAAEYVLRPGESHEGVWHVEGMPHERIVATGIHYLSASPSLSPGKLAFRRPMTEQEAWRIQAKHYVSNPPLFASDASPSGREPPSAAVPLGEVPTPPGSSLVFPNGLQHKLLPLLCDGAAAEAGSRKMVCFFLVGALAMLGAA